MFYYEKPKITDVFQYDRKSLDEKDVRQAHSLPMQEEFNLEFADRMNLRIIERFVDDASAKIPNNRPEFARMLKELSYKDKAKRRADGVLSWHPDRLARNGLEAGKIVQMLTDDLIKDMYFPTYRFHNDPSGIEHLMMEFGRAISYSGWLSINSKRGSTGRERKGAWVYGRSKFGYIKKREVPESPKLCSLFPIPDPNTFPARQRLVELWKDGIPDDQCRMIIKREFGFSLSRSGISKLRADPFNYGIYIIKEGEEDERRIDFRTLEAPDGTKFSPVTDEKTYWSFQTFKRKEEPNKQKRKHTNPFQGLILCGSCESGLRPARRKIHRTGEIIKELGYECHTVSSKGKRCKQCRVRMPVLSAQFSAVIKAKFGELNKKHYQQYRVGLEQFIGKKKHTDRARRGTLTKRLKTLETEKSEVIRRKLAAIDAYQYDDETRKWCRARLKELDKNIGEIKSDIQKCQADNRHAIATFKKFIELKENLHWYWHNANEGQKKRLAEKIVLNLIIEGPEIRSVTWKSPLSGAPNLADFYDGGALCHSIELYFTTLWHCLFETAEQANSGYWDSDDSQDFHDQNLPFKIT